MQSTALILNTFSWRDPSMLSCQKAVLHAKTFIHEIFDNERKNCDEVGFPADVDLIETGDFFSNLGVGLPYEFNFMIDLTSMTNSYSLAYI